MTEELESQEGQGVSVVGATARRPTGSSARERGARRPESSARVVDEAESEDPGSAPARRAGRHARRFSFGAPVVLSAVTVVAVACAIVFGLMWANLKGQNDERQAVKQQATSFLTDLTNFKPTTVDAVFNQLQNFAATGSVFAKQAAQTLNSSIRQELVQAQAYSQGQIRDVYVESLSGSNAEVYAVVDQAYQNSKMTSPATDTLRVTLDMVDTSNGWRVSAVTEENPAGTPAAPSTPTTTKP